MNVFELIGSFTSEQIADLDGFARDWAFLTNQPVEDAAIDIAGAYYAHPRSNRRARMIERLGFDPFGGTPDELIAGLRKRIGGAAPDWYGKPSPTEALLTPIADALERPLIWVAKKLSWARSS